MTGLAATNRPYDSLRTVAITGTGTLSGVVFADTATVALSGVPTGQAALADVGTRVVTISGLSLTGVDAGNYTLTSPTPNVVISSKTITLSGLTAPGRAYDRTTSVAITGTPALVGVESSDSGLVATSGTATGTADASGNAGARTITVGGLTLTGTRAANYSLTTLTLSATIAQKELTITGYTPTARAYDGLRTITVTGTKVSGS